MRTGSGIHSKVKNILLLMASLTSFPFSIATYFSKISQFFGKTTKQNMLKFVGLKMQLDEVNELHMCVMVGR